MKLRLERNYLKDEFTIGNLYIDDKFFCYTMEDKYRDLSVEKKVMNETCIPYGTYKVSLNIQSPKYSKVKKYDFCKGFLPRLLNVPYFEGILIHIGNYHTDTSGCILVGDSFDLDVPMVRNSTTTFYKLYDILLKDSENIEIEIIEKDLTQ